jgi:hypothetical protein
VLEKQEQEACEAARTAELELQRSLMEQYNAEADRVFAEKQAKQEAINAARLEHELKLEQERKQNQEKQRKIKDEKRKRDLATAEMKTKLYTIGGLVVFGALNYLSGSIQKQTKKSEIPPLTSKIEPE